jgi:hypothetical protein
MEDTAAHYPMIPIAAPSSDCGRRGLLGTATHHAGFWAAASRAGFAETAPTLARPNKEVPWWGADAWHLYDATDYAENLPTFRSSPTRVKSIRKNSRQTSWSSARRPAELERPLTEDGAQ